jgi:hypothetical protein
MSVILILRLAYDDEKRKKDKMILFFSFLLFFFSVLSSIKDTATETVLFSYSYKHTHVAETTRQNMKKEKTFPTILKQCVKTIWAIENCGVEKVDSETRLRLRKIFFSGSGSDSEQKFFSARTPTPTPSKKFF